MNCYNLSCIIVRYNIFTLLRCTGVESWWNIDWATRDGVRVLCGTVSGRDVHHSHASRQSVLRRQPHRSVLPHLSHLVPRLLSSGRVRRQGQPRDNDSSRSGRVPADGRWNDAANTRCHSHLRYCTVDTKAVSNVYRVTFLLLFDFSVAKWVLKITEFSLSL